MSGRAAPRPESAPRRPARRRAARAHGPTRCARPFPPRRTTSSTLGHARLRDYQDRAYADLYLRAARRGPRGRAPSRCRRRARLCADARDRALSRVVDGVRRHRARRRPEMPREPLRARAPRGRRRRAATSCASSTTSSPACPSSRRCCRRRWRRGSLPGTGAARRAASVRCRSRSRLRTDSVTGFVALRALAGLRWLRRHGARYAQEQALIERWLAAIGTARCATTGSWRTRSRCAAG